MADCRLMINGQQVCVPEGTLVAVALALAGVTTYRRSVCGEPRAPLCGMGICGECRVTINGHAQQVSCQLVCADGMEVTTDA